MPNIKSKKSGISGLEPYILAGLVLVGLLCIVNLVYMLTPAAPPEETAGEKPRPQPSTSEILIKLNRLTDEVRAFNNVLSLQQRETLRLNQLINGLESQLAFVPKSSTIPTQLSTPEPMGVQHGAR